MDAHSLPGDRKGPWQTHPDGTRGLIQTQHPPRVANHIWWNSGDIFWGLILFF
jgi:hypothetical protein